MVELRRLLAEVQHFATAVGGRNKLAAGVVNQPRPLDTLLNHHPWDGGAEGRVGKPIIKSAVAAARVD